MTNGRRCGQLGNNENAFSFVCVCVSSPPYYDYDYDYDYDCVFGGRGGGVVGRGCIGWCAIIGAVGRIGV